MIHHKYAQLCMPVKMQKFKDPPYILLLVVTRWTRLFQKSFLEPQSPHSKCSETKGKELEEE